MRLSGYNRLAFLLESLTDLDRQLRLRGGRLMTARGQPVDVLQMMKAEHGMTHLSFEQVSGDRRRPGPDPAASREVLRRAGRPTRPDRFAGWVLTFSSAAAAGSDICGPNAAVKRRPTESGQSRRNAALPRAVTGLG